MNEFATPYNYVGGDPINVIDPDGMYTGDPCYTCPSAITGATSPSLVGPTQGTYKPSGGGTNWAGVAGYGLSAISSGIGLYNALSNSGPQNFTSSQAINSSSSQVQSSRTFIQTPPVRKIGIPKIPEFEYDEYADFDVASDYGPNDGKIAANAFIKILNIPSDVIESGPGLYKKITSTRMPDIYNGISKAQYAYKKFNFMEYMKSSHTGENNDLAASSLSFALLSGGPKLTQGVNPRTLIRTETGRTWKVSTRNVANIMKSAKKVGIQKPIDVFVLNGKSYIINGHHRVEAAMRLGQNVPINYLSSPGNYSNIYELQIAAQKASLSPFKVDGRMLKKLLKK